MKYHCEGQIKALRGPRPIYKLESHGRQQSPQLPSLVNTRRYIKQVTIQNIFFTLFVRQTVAMPTHSFNFA